VGVRVERVIHYKLYTSSRGRHAKSRTTAY
jgi:hypothetical protein